MDLPQTVRNTIEEHQMVRPGETVVIGLSGGPDSLCLLHVLRTLRLELQIELYVAHLEHGIRGAASRADAEFVRNLAQSWHLPVSVEHADVPRYSQEQKLAMEEAARRVRYLFLGRVVTAVGAGSAAVGHNADDQVETILMHWMRGSGLEGLRGIPPVQELGAEPWWSGPPLRVIRPLLEVPRPEIEAYCARQGLQPRFDRSNLDLTYHRNRIRHELIPHLESFNPRIREILRRSAKTIADDYDYLRHQSLQAWDRLVEETEETISFPLEPWTRLHPSLQRQLLREAIRRLRKSLRDITWTHVEQARVGVEKLDTGGRITLPQGLFLTKGYHRFVIGESRPYPDLPLLWESPLALSVPGHNPLPDSPWVLHCQIMTGDGASPIILDNPDPWHAYLDLDKAGRDLTLRVRRTGDRFQPLGMGGQSKSLTDFMIDAKIPQHLRDLLPLVVSPQHIVWVAGYRVDERVQVTSETRQILHLWFAKEA
ncbi:MAG TPA: tRNA lysidine(34) synthetase TilS [Chloroflexi bacterium]|nr:tRNA lysidine(34) synthetase TilS [Chloroflexota bacterium]